MEYINIKGLEFMSTLPIGAANALIGAWKSGDRVRIFYGDVDTGEQWMEDHDVSGYVEPAYFLRMPVLAYSKRSVSTTPIMQNCLVRIIRTKDGKELWRAANYQDPYLYIAPTPDWLRDAGYNWGVHDAREKNLANFRTKAKAQAYIDFQKGKRMRHW